MSQQKLLKNIISVLEKTNIDYMVTGSVASSLQGEPRSTHDIDILVDIKEQDIPNLLKAVNSYEYYLDEESIFSAIESKQVFNLISSKDGSKVDFWILKNKPFDNSRFSRKYFEEIFGKKIKVSTPEDTILAKLNWAKISGGSEKQFIDALRVYELQYNKLDIEYIKEWVNKLEVKNYWKRLQDEAEIF